MARAGPRGFFFIRHGETDANREGRLQGQRDTPLNALGERQAAAAGATLARLVARRGLAPAALATVSSPLLRARATMRRVRAALALPPEPFACDDRLKEIAFGAWEGRTWADLKAADRPAIEARRRALWGYVPPDGESYRMLAERVAPWLAALPEDAVVVAHGGVARALLHLAAGLDERDAPTREVHQGRVLVFEDGAARWA